ncbi:MAG: hypothetical protein AAFZ58_03035, partial [Pseudomonadota bacterium]
TEMFTGYDQQDELVENYLRNPDMRSQVEHMALEEIAVNRLIELGSEETRNVNFDDYMNP